MYFLLRPRSVNSNFLERFILHVPRGLAMARSACDLRRLTCGLGVVFGGAVVGLGVLLRMPLQFGRLPITRVLVEHAARRWSGKLRHIGGTILPSQSKTSHHARPVPRKAQPKGESDRD